MKSDNHEQTKRRESLKQRAGRTLFDWWQKLFGAPSGCSPRPGELPNEMHQCSLQGTAGQEYLHCRHGRLRKELVRLTRRPRVSGDGGRVNPRLCPICGLLPPGSQDIEYALRVRFLSGQDYEYFFQGRWERDCYRITDSVLSVYLKDSTVHHPLHAVASVEFRVRRIRPKPPEVVEAERIIGTGRQST
ncbi:MAG TPA: hypothetical protein VMY05_10270 [Acidobacteriota bacterium]|nr:hypothetical protein [Acidobacteriota bacterium]